MSVDTLPAVPWYRSIRFKLVATAIVVEIFMLGLLLANSYRLVTEALESQTQARLDALTPLLDASLAGRVFQRDHSEIESILRQLVAKQPTEFRYIVVLGPRGEKLAQVGAAPAAAEDDTSVAAALADLTYDTQTPLTLPGGTHAGTVRFGLSLTELAGLRGNVLRQSLWIAGAAVLLTLLLLAFVSYLLTRHLAVLLAATRRVAQGDYSTPIGIRTKDEIGMLADNFSLMAATLECDAAERQHHQNELEFLAHHDSLTHLPNRVLLADRMHQALAQTQRAQRLLAIAYLDLDDFKPVNDALGHETGDLLLTMVAQRIKEHIRAGDTVCRLGGDEFVLLLNNLATIEECTQTIERLLAAIAAPYRFDHQTIQISASVGLTIYPFDDADTDTLMRHADQAMYLAKQGGRNCFHLFDAEHDRQEQARHSNRARIEAALPRNEFVLYYQPKVDMQSGTVIGAEALIRWQHPEEGLLPPGKFLAEIEDTNFSIPLGEWVIATAIAQIAAWRAVDLPLKISVNISPRHLQSPTFAERLAALLASYPEVPPAALELEVVESAALEDVVRVAQVIDRCHALGVTFALDDFGTGYSSLSYFKRLHVDVLKIDQSFVRDMLTDDEDHAIVEGVISLTRTFKRQVVAEGVETAEIGAALLALGCSIAQGYGIARPMPAAALPGWVATWRPDPLWQA
ncbi:MAG: EAL domain-containing protein [Rhodocyclaceae bacterium]|nr:EAL domain-containing protein [Rhodocyclaceae bacterium]